MEMIQLLSFYEIVKTGSFLKASKNVLRSQPAISHQMKNLEEELEIKLFERLGKKIKLTAEGEVLFEVTSRLFDEFDNMKRIYQDMKSGTVGHLTIASGSATMMYILPNIIKRLQEQFPQLKFKLINCSPFSEIQSMILTGDVDFGIGRQSTELLPTSIKYVIWKSFDNILLAPRNHPLSENKTIKLRDICKYPLVLPRRQALIRNMLEQPFVQNKLSYKIAMETDLAENIKRYVQMGIGISILPSLAITDKDRENFFFFNVSDLFGKTDYGIYIRKGKYITTPIKRFFELFDPELIDKLAEHRQAEKDIPGGNRRHNGSPGVSIRRFSGHQI